MDESVEDILYMVQLAEKCERYDDMVEYMEKITEAAEAEQEDLTPAEKKLLSSAYKNLIGPRRAAWRMVSSIEQKGEIQQNEGRLNAIKEFKSQIELELTSICGGILNQLESRLIPFGLTDESRVFYKKMTGDFYRYLSEFKTGSEFKEAVDKTLEAYRSATDIAVERLSPVSTYRLGLALNFSIFYYHVLDFPDQAYALANKAFIEAKKEVFSLEGKPEFKDVTQLMQLLRENLQLWTASPQEDDAEEETASNCEEEEE